MENECKCRTCKFLRGMIAPTDEGFKKIFICMSNESCYIEMTHMLNLNLHDCSDYVEKTADVEEAILEQQELQKLAIQINYLRNKKEYDEKNNNTDERDE